MRVLEKRSDQSLLQSTNRFYINLNDSLFDQPVENKQEVEMIREHLNLCEHPTLNVFFLDVQGDRGEDSTVTGGPVSGFQSLPHHRC